MIVLICKRVQFWIVALATITSIAPTSSTLIPMRKVGSRVSKHNFAGRPFYIKRDDENCIKGIQDSVSGNKSRKLLYLSSRMPFPKIIASYGGSQSNSMLAIAKVTAASSENSSFFYFLKPLPKFLRNAPTGNLKAALDLGMQLVEVSGEVYEELVNASKTSTSIPESAMHYIKNKVGMIHDGVEGASLASDTYWMPQGAAMPEAEEGVKVLVDEICTYILDFESNSSFQSKPWKIIFASGTGTMALFAARHFALKGKLNDQKSQYSDIEDESEIENGVTIDDDIDNSPITTKNRQYSNICDENARFVTSSMISVDSGTNFTTNCTISIEVIAIPCVGDSANLLQQMTALDSVSGRYGIYPLILNSVKGQKKNSRMNDNIEMDYNNIMNDSQDFVNRSDGKFGEPSSEHYRIWLRLQEEIGVEFDLIYSPRAFELLLDSFENNARLWENCNILYYHCGGVEGNKSQLGRYRYKGLL